MRRISSFTACLLATAVLVPPAFAANPAPTAQPAATATQKNADQDFGMLSKDGMEAFRDMHMARLAIFNADPAKAKSEINDAKAALDKAKNDNTAFMKAEADLKPSMSKTSAPSPAKTTGAASGEKIAWLPVDSQLSLGENFVATPEKAGAVADANKHIQSGDKKGAMERLKLANIDVDMTVAILPLNQTVTDVGTAAAQIDGGMYYEANATLKGVEDRMRFDIVDTTATPKGATAAPANAAPTASATTPAPAPVRGQ